VQQLKDVLSFVAYALRFSNLTFAEFQLCDNMTFSLQVFEIDPSVAFQ
jgi:hypothetical protein|tara:strand:- start:809 stop:952 length:144 start_codon:yes stop_codon:yes gene_type:complete